MAKLTNSSNQTLNDKNRSITIDEIKTKYLKGMDVVNSKCSTVISYYTDVTKHISNADHNIPNIGITFYNKYMEFSKLFNKKGISIYVRSPNGSPFIKSSIIGLAIYNDMISITDEGLNELAMLRDTFNSMYNKKSKEVNRLSTKIIRTIKKQKKNTRIFTDEDVNILNSHVEEYKKIDNMIWNYNLKERLPVAIVNQLTHNHSVDRLSMIICLGEVEKDLKALGYESIFTRIVKEVFTMKDPQTGEFIF